MYAERRHQKGHGLGGLLQGVFRTVAPALLTGVKTIGKRTLKAVGQSAIREGGGFITDVLRGANPQRAASQRLKNTGRAALAGMLGQHPPPIKRKASAAQVRPSKVRRRFGPPIGIPSRRKGVKRQRAFSDIFS